MTPDGGRMRRLLRTGWGWGAIACGCALLAALGYAGQATFIGASSSSLVTELPPAPTTSTPTNAAAPANTAPESDAAALPKCEERLAGHQATSVDDVVLERAYLSNAATVFRYQRSIHTDEYETSLEDEPRNEKVFVCWFSTSGYTFSPKIGDNPPEIDRVVEALTDSGDIFPLLRGKKSESTPVRPS